MFCNIEDSCTGQKTVKGPRPLSLSSNSDYSYHINEATTSSFDSGRTIVAKEQK
jgi:hypothetical protein